MTNDQHNAEVQRIESLTLAQIMDERDFLPTTWADIVGGPLPKDRHQTVYIDLSALVQCLADRK